MLSGMRRAAVAVLAVLLATVALVLPPAARASDEEQAPLRPLRVDLRPLYGPQPPRGRRAEDAERFRLRGRFLTPFVFLAAPAPPPALTRADPAGPGERKSPGRHESSTAPAPYPAL
jgi:hypothetical protein